MAKKNKTTSSTKLSMKLLINTSTNKVLFAEANKVVIDFLFGLLEMPLGSVVKLLIANEAPSTVGSIESLYNSIQAVDDTYLQSSGTKATLVDPLGAKSSLSHTTLLLPDIPAKASKKFYRTNCSHNFFSDVCGTPCPTCQNGYYNMAIEMKFVSGDSVSANASATGSGNAMDVGGFVKGVVTYSIMDDLTVTPMSMISSIAMLNKFNVKDVGGLKEKIVALGFDEGLAILKASLHSKTALSDVFLKNSK